MICPTKGQGLGCAWRLDRIDWCKCTAYSDPPAIPAEVHQRKNTDIEVLRAVAILMTVLVHLDRLIVWNPAWLSAFHSIFFPWGGVDLFFCISGFVITGNLLRALSTDRGGRFSSFAIPFWTRRIWRILPSAWLWLLIPIGLSLWCNRMGYLGTPALNTVDALAGVGQVANFYFWHCFSMPDGHCGIDRVYWSLSLEEQTYILLPLLLFFFKQRTVIGFLVALIAVQLFLNRPALSFLWYARTDSIALGVLLALTRNGAWYGALEPKSLTRPILGGVVLAVCCILLGMLSGAFAFISFRTGLIALLSASTVWIASYGKGYTLAEGRLKRVLVYLGARSYAIYLIHIPVFRLTPEIWERMVGPWASSASYTVPFVMTALPATLMLAELNYRLVETPLRRYGAGLAERQESSYARERPVAA